MRCSAARGAALLVLNHGPLPVDAVCLSRFLHASLGRWPRFLGERKLFEHPALAARAECAHVEGHPLTSARSHRRAVSASSSVA